MNAKELITHLEDLIDLYGNLPVHIGDNEYNDDAKIREINVEEEWTDIRYNIKHPKRIVLGI
jgi:hypothetical protein